MAWFVHGCRSDLSHFSQPLPLQVLQRVALTTSSLGVADTPNNRVALLKYEPRSGSNSQDKASRTNLSHTKYLILSKAAPPSRRKPSTDRNHNSATKHCVSGSLSTQTEDSVYLIPEHSGQQGTRAIVPLYL